MKKNTKPLISIVIAHWNAGNRTVTCLEQIGRWNYITEHLDVLVVDNGSTDDSAQALVKHVELLRKNGLSIRYYRFDKHPGLTASLTASLKLINTKSKFLLRLDNDVELNLDALSLMVDIMQKKPEVGVVGPRLVYTSSPNQLNGGAVWINPWGGKNKIGDSSQPVECDTLLGAAMLFRVQALQELGRWFDPKLYLFAEEPEICWQLRDKGYSTLYLPQAEGRHDTAQSTGKHSALSEYLNYRNHTIVYSRMFSIFVNTFRNLILFPRILVRCWRRKDFIPLIGFMDGLIAHPLNDNWWQESIQSNTFRRP